MHLRNQQREHLQQTIEWARKIEQHLAATRARHLGKVHFRPSANGISMVGLLPERPQRGKSSIKNLTRLAEHFDEQFRIHCDECNHGRPTPEKQLQSYLVAAAYRQGRVLRDLDPSSPEGGPLFITDELSLPTADGRIVCDLLALHGDRPAVIELKPSRAMKRLVEQVTTYAALVEEHLDLFGDLYSVILGRTLVLRPPCERWIVWPRASDDPRDPREDALAEFGIRVVAYSTKNDRYRFRVGRAVTAG